MYKQLGDAMGVQNGYTSEYSKDLYDHGGTTDAWSYYTTGALSFVFEMNASAFHPPYSEMVSEWDATGSGGNRGAFKKMMAFVADPTGHAVLTGTGPPGAVLRVARDVTTDTQEGPDVPDHLESTMVIPASGQFEWHVNQSTQPLVLKSGQTNSWTLTCENPEGAVRTTRQVTIGRGQSQQVDVGQCASPVKPEVNTTLPTTENPTTPPDVLEQPGLSARLKASFDGRLYRVVVKGTLTQTADLDMRGGANGSDRCAGKVTVTLSAKRRKVASGRADVDAACGFEREFKLKRSKLPRALRTRRGLRSLKAVARYSGGPYLLGASDDVSARVKKRRR
jgi:hypothetical protein